MLWDIPMMELWDIPMMLWDISMMKLWDILVMKWNCEIFRWWNSCGRTLEFHPRNLTHIFLWTLSLVSATGCVQGQQYFMQCANLTSRHWVRDTEFVTCWRSGAYISSSTVCNEQTGLVGLCQHLVCQYHQVLTLAATLYKMERQEIVTLSSWYSGRWVRDTVWNGQTCHEFWRVCHWIRDTEFVTCWRWGEWYLDHVCMWYWVCDAEFVTCWGWSRDI